MSAAEVKAHWKCGECGYTMVTAKPPETCPECQKACSFKDVSCYLPDCGGPGNKDPRL
jgi:rubrerythrin